MVFTSPLQTPKTKTWVFHRFMSKKSRKKGLFFGVFDIDQNKAKPCTCICCLFSYAWSSYSLSLPANLRHLRRQSLLEAQRVVQECPRICMGVKVRRRMLSLNILGLPTSSLGPCPMLSCAPMCGQASAYQPTCFSCAHRTHAYGGSPECAAAWGSSA